MATRKKKDTPSNVEDIDHVDVPAQNAAPAVQQPQEAVVVEAEEDPAKTLELTVQREIKRFGIADAGIQELNKKYGDLTIVDMNDKPGYEAVKKAWNEVRTVRTGLEKKGKDIRSSYTIITKKVKEEEDRLIGLVTPLEESLQQKWKKVDDEREAEKQRKLAEAEKKLQDRVEQLLNAGCKFENGYYGIGGTIAIDVATLRTMDEDQYGKLLKAVEGKAAELKAEEERIAQQRAEEDAERERERLRLKDEADRLQKEKEELKKQQDDLEKQKQEAAQAKREMRLDLLDAVGMTISAGGKEVVYDNDFTSYRLSMEDILNATDAEFKVMVQGARGEIAECKRKLEEHLKQKDEEKRVLENKKAYINELFIAAGFSYQYGKDLFHFHNGQLNVEYRMDALVAMGEEDIAELAEKEGKNITKAKIDQEDHNERAAYKAKKERDANLSDGVLMLEYLNELGKVPVPKLKTKTMQIQLAQFLGKFAILMDEYRPAKEAVPA